MKKALTATSLIVLLLIASSLPFHQFASRVYAYHYHPSEADGAPEVSAAEIEQVKEIAKNSWGTSYKWWMEFPQPIV